MAHERQVVPLLHIRCAIVRPMAVCPSDNATPRYPIPRLHPSPPPNDSFRKFSHAIADAMGRSQTFILAVAIIAIWAVCGPLFHFSDTWQLVINTGTTIITFLMVFLIQNTQNRDAQGDSS